MARYLVTVSWVDPKQELRRLKHTEVISVNLGGSRWDILDSIDSQMYGGRNINTDFAIDFMMKLEDE